MSSHTARTILQEVLDAFPVADRWADEPFGRIRRTQAASRGKVGQEFVAKLCEQLGLKKEEGETQSPWDIRIMGRTFEVKTVTEGSNRTFQFNHIRYHRSYEFLMCLGITPCDIVFDAWSKADVVTGKAGRLVTMEKAANASFKLSKRTDQLKSIDSFRDDITRLVKLP